MNNVYQLAIRKGPKPGQIFSLFSATAIVGRDPICDITINDPEVSRQHARFTQTSDSYQIEDLGSTNGTFVNGKQIGSEPIQLAHGNEIQFGSGVNLIFELAPDDDDDDVIGLETAVPPSPIEEPKSDPMMVPDFDHLTVIDNSPLTAPYDAIEYDDAIEMEDELDAIFAEENIPPPPATPRLTIDASSPRPPAPQDKNPARRLFAMGMGLILLMMCCCCGLLFFMYQWGGDWILQQMGLIP